MVGSFRRFHALEQAVDAAARMNNAALPMVGDGPERTKVEQLARDCGVISVFTGTVPFAELPAYWSAMDVALVLAERDGAFHYSPLKLAEYLGAGLPVIAPRVAQCTERLRDGVDALLVTPGDTSALAEALEYLRDDPPAHARRLDCVRGPPRKRSGHGTSRCEESSPRWVELQSVPDRA